MPQLQYSYRSKSIAHENMEATIYLVLGNLHRKGNTRVECRIQAFLNRDKLKQMYFLLIEKLPERTPANFCCLYIPPTDGWFWRSSPRTSTLCYKTLRGERKQQ